MRMPELLRFGLSEHEAEIYLLLVEHGPCPASTLAKHTEISRTHVYDSLNSLVAMGLASFAIRENKRHFQAADPNRFLEMLREKENELRELKGEFGKVIPHIKKLAPKQREQFEVKVFLGKEGFKTIFLDLSRHVKKGAKWRTIGWTGRSLEVAGAWWLNFLRQMDEMGVKRHVIASSEKKGLKELQGKNVEVRWLPEGMNLPSSIILYADRVVIFHPLKNDFFGVMMIGKQLAAAYNIHFELLWKIGAS